MAIKLRRNEKRILLRTIATCETGLEALNNAALPSPRGSGSGGEGKPRLDGTFWG